MGGVWDIEREKRGMKKRVWIGRHRVHKGEKKQNKRERRMGGNVGGQITKRRQKGKKRVKRGEGEDTVSDCGSARNGTGDSKTRPSNKHDRRRWNGVTIDGTGYS